MDHPLYSIDKWADSLSGHASEDFLNHARETRHDTAETFISLNLPTYRRHLLVASDFLTDPQTYLKDFRTPLSWFQVVNPEGKYSQNNIATDKLPQVVSAHVSDYNSALLVSEYLPNIYGGNIVVTPQGRIIAEFGEGTNTDYTSKNKTPTHFVTSRLGTNTLDYSFDDPKLKQILWQTIRPLRIGGEPQPGYYEFIIGDDNGVMRPIFIDARIDNPIYQVPEISIDSVQAKTLGRTSIQIVQNH